MVPEDLSIRELRWGRVHSQITLRSVSPLPSIKNRQANEAYGTGETPLLQENGDPVSDQLYVTLGLHEAARALGEARLQAVEDRLAHALRQSEMSPFWKISALFYAAQSVPLWCDDDSIVTVFGSQYLIVMDRGRQGGQRRQFQRIPLL